MAIKRHYYPRNYKKFKEAVKKYRKQRWLFLEQKRLKNGDLSIRVGRNHWSPKPRFRPRYLSSLADGRTAYGRLIFKRVPLKVKDWDYTLTFKQAWKLHQVLRRLDRNA
jgi:hypothetical protein